MKIAIVVPFYNVEKYITEAIESLKEQTYGEFVAYLVDDGSEDQSCEVAAKAIEGDQRFFLLRQTNSGVSSARNLALRHIYNRTDIDFVGFLDGDDKFNKNLFEIFNQQVDESIDYCVFGLVRFDKNGDIPEKIADLQCVQRLNHDEVIKHFWVVAPEERNFTHTQCLCNRFYAFRLLKGHFFDETMELGEDQELFFSLSEQIQHGIALPYIGLRYRQRISSACNKTCVYKDLPELYYCLKKYVIKESNKKHPNSLFIEGAVMHMIAYMGRCIAVYDKEKLGDADYEFWEKYRKECKFMLDSHIVKLSFRQKRRFLTFLLPLFFVRYYLRYRQNKKNDKEKSTIVSMNYYE